MVDGIGLKREERICGQCGRGGFSARLRGGRYRQLCMRTKLKHKHLVITYNIMSRCGSSVVKKPTKGFFAAIIPNI